MEESTADGKANSQQRAKPSVLRGHADAVAAQSPVTPDQHSELVQRLEESLSQVQFERSRWEAIVASILDPLVVADADGRAIYMNPAYTQMAGYGISQGLEMGEHPSHYRLFKPDGTMYESADLPLQRAALSGEEVRGAEIVHETTTGERLLTLWNASPIRGPGGIVIGAIATGRDVTEQRRAEEMRARLAAIVESSEDAIIGKTLDGIVTSWNRGAERLYGYTAYEMIGMSIATVIPPESAHEFGGIMSRLRTGQRVDRFETARVRKDGRRVLVSVTISPIRDEEGRIIGASTVARDITERRRNLDAQQFLADVSASLSASLEYESTLETVASLAVPKLADVCIVDAIEDHHVRQRASSQVVGACDHWVNAIQSHYALDAEEAHPVWEVMRSGRPRLLLPAEGHGQDDEERGSLPEALVEAGARACFVVPIEIRGQPAGAISLISLTSGEEDDPHRLNLAKEFASRAGVAIDNAKLYRDARGAVRARDEFLSMAAHELKTPMTSLRGFVQLAMRQIDRDGAVDPMQIRQALRVIDQQSRRLSALVSQLLDVTRLEAGRLALERRVVDVSSLVEALVGAAGAAHPDHTIDAEIRPMVLALLDQTRFEQVVTALIDNAAKFSPAGTQIDLELSQPSRGALRLAVRDRGPGVPSEQRSQIFTRFYHGHPNEHAGGMGLGLYMSREIVHLHGGTIKAEFPEDGGSRFVVTLPVHLGGSH